MLKSTSSIYLSYLPKEKGLIAETQIPRDSIARIPLTLQLSLWSFE